MCRSLPLFASVVLLLSSGTLLSAKPEPDPYPIRTHLIEIDLASGKSRLLREAKEKVISILAAGEGVVCIREGWKYSWRIHGISTRSGEILWSRHSNETTYSRHYRDQDLPGLCMSRGRRWPVGHVVRDGMAYVFASSRGHAFCLLGLAIKTGAVRWHLGPGVRTDRGSGPTWCGPQIVGDLVLASDQKQTYGVHRLTGNVLFRADRAQRFAVDDETVVGWWTDLKTVRLWRLDRETGKVEQRVTLPRHSRLLGIHQDAVIYTEAEPTRYAALRMVARSKHNLDRVVWSSPYSHYFHDPSGLIRHEDKLVGYTDHCLLFDLSRRTIRSLEDRRSARSPDDPAFPLMLTGRSLYAISHLPTKLMEFDPQTGEARRLIWSFEEYQKRPEAKHRGHSPSHALHANGRLYMSLTHWF